VVICLSEVQTCIWPSGCHCYSLSLASVKSRLVLPFWYWLTQVVLEKGPLNGCVCVCVCLQWAGRCPQNCLSPWWDPGLHLIYDSMVPCESISQMASSTGSTNCIVHGWDQQTDRQTGHSTAITIGIAKQQKMSKEQSQRYLYHPYTYIRLTALCAGLPR